MSLLSTNNRYLNGTPLSAVRKPYRSTEKCLFFVIFGTFVLIFCGTFYLPELGGSSTTRDSISRVYKRMQDAAPELLFPAPPHAEALRENARPFHRHMDIKSDEDPHLLEDRHKLAAKIREEQLSQKVLERPDIFLKLKASSPSAPVVNAAESVAVVSERILTVPPAAEGPRPVVVGGEDADEDIRQKRLKIVEVCNLEVFVFIVY